jgi:hypothetical protein
MENSAVGWAVHSSGRARLEPGLVLVKPRMVGATKGTHRAYPAAGVPRSPPACTWLGSPWQFLAAGLASPDWSIREDSRFLSPTEEQRSTGQRQAWTVGVGGRGLSSDKEGSKKKLESLRSSIVPKKPEA